MTDNLRTKEMIHRATFGIPNGIKNAISISVASGVDNLIGKYNL